MRARDLLSVMNGDTVCEPGSRERTRELGYACAMAEMYFVLDALAAAWKAQEVRAAEDENMYAAQLLGYFAARVEACASYAHGMWALHEGPLSPLSGRSMVGLQWSIYPAPMGPDAAAAVRDA